MEQILCIKLVKYWDKYTETHGQQNVGIVYCCYDMSHGYVISMEHCESNTCEVAFHS